MRTRLSSKSYSSSRFDVAASRPLCLETNSPDAERQYNTLPLTMTSTPMSEKYTSAQSTPAPSTPGSARGSTEISRSSTPTASIASGSAEKTPDDTSKLRTFLSILKRFIGVTDIAAVRFSLPAQLLEPIPNLEYWHYLDRPETFVAIGDSEDPLGRMLGCLRFWFTKDLKYVKGKPCKPYNSTLGEFFRCQWEVEDTAQSLKGVETKPNLHQTPMAPEGESTKGKPVKVSYLTEQTSHHPPVSAYYVDCPDKGISARGFDQLSAKFTGTNIRVIPGNYNLGIFVTLHRWEDETYQLTHPAAYLGGFIRGSLNVTVADTCFISCPRTGIKVILHYLEEGYFGKTQNKVEGVVYKCDVEKDNTTRIKDVPDKNVLGRIDGCWTDKVYFIYGNTEWKKAAVSPASKNSRSKLLTTDRTTGQRQNPAHRCKPALPSSQASPPARTPAAKRIAPLLAECDRRDRIKAVQQSDPREARAGRATTRESRRAQSP